LIRKSWVVLIHAVMLSFQSIVVEWLTVLLQMPPLVIAACSIPLAGAVLLAISRLVIKKKITVFKSWKYLFPSAAFLSAGIFTWYDAVHRIGASKDGLLAGPIETVSILFLAYFFLKERMNNVQLAGVMITIIGFFMTIVSGKIELSLLSLLSFSLGDIEAILSAITYAAGIIFLTKLLTRHSSIEVTGASLLIAGLILAAFLWTTTPHLIVVRISDWIILLIFSILPLLAALFYSKGLETIGASLTSTISSSTILLTLLFQVTLGQFGIKSNLLENIPLITLAIIGGALGIYGICLIHLQKVIPFQRI
jgi:drug/metabolite transporter (DMT)-like permease